MHARGLPTGLAHPPVYASLARIPMRRHTGRVHEEAPNDMRACAAKMTEKEERRREGGGRERGRERGREAGRQAGRERERARTLTDLAEPG